ncbi:hypothetical protein C8R43DRAFT_103359 [Mycena crocata]|nr:hypothetical protein C8R43DRAFT_103359 [Mycena crocata]
MASTEGFSAPRPLCGVCNHRYAIYTCPRCATRTCSLPCASTHKTGAGCSGERDKAAYVPMNKYGWGTMMDDYAFLEDVGRKVGDWGSEIARGKFQAQAGAAGSSGSGPGRGRGGGRGRGRAQGRGGGNGGGRTKRDVLRMQLETREIEMDILPAGMERHKLNQSSWDSKKQTALLTIELKFHPPPNPLAPPTQAPEPPFTLLTHRNGLDTPLLALIQRHITERKEGACPAWVRPLVCPDVTDPDGFSPPQCVMTAAVDPLAIRASSNRSKRPYYRFDATQDLAALLRHTHFVEFPTIEVWEEFAGTVVDGAGAVTQFAQEERAPKRRRLDKKAGGKVLVGLLDGYGSSGDDEEEKVQVQDGLGMLGGYSGSDDDEGAAASAMQGEIVDSDIEEVEMDPAALLELMRKARGDENWTPHTDDDDQVDWGDSDQDT